MRRDDDRFGPADVDVVFGGGAGHFAEREEGAMDGGGGIVEDVAGSERCCCEDLRGIS